MNKYSENQTYICDLTIDDKMFEIKKREFIRSLLYWEYLLEFEFFMSNFSVLNILINLNANYSTFAK